MKVLKKDLKQSFMKLKVLNNEDLWYLSHIIEKDDIISANTERKIKIGQEPNIKTIRKKVFLTITVEKIEYEPNLHSLRALGPIKSGPDDVSLGSYHTINLTKNDEFELIKDFDELDLKKIKESSIESKDTLILIFDRDTALFYELKKIGVEKILELNGDVQKKGFDQKTTNFYKELSKILSDYSKKYEKIILASPAFFKEYLLKELSEEIIKKTIQSTVSSVNDTSINELLKNQTLKNELDNFNSSKEAKIIEDIMIKIKSDEAFYGFDESLEKISIGSAKIVVVSENLLRKYKEEDNYKSIDDLMKLAKSMNSNIHIISDDESMKQLDSLGGIAGILRWTI